MDHEPPDAVGPGAPLVKRGERYFCPECGHMMAAPHDRCPTCELPFAGVIEEVEHGSANPPTEDDIARGDELVTAERRTRLSLALVSALLLTALLAALYLLCVR